MNMHRVVLIFALLQLIPLSLGCNLFAGEPCQSGVDCASTEQCVAGFCVSSAEASDGNAVDGGYRRARGEDGPQTDSGAEIADAGVMPTDASEAHDANADVDSGVASLDAGVQEDAAGPVLPEICDDGLDNDGDQKIDCLDPACQDAPACLACTTFTTASGIYRDCGQRSSLVAAQSRCAELGARVVSIETSGEQTALSAILAGRLAWLGVTDRVVEGEYRSLTFPFRPPAQMPFADGQPDNGVISMPVESNPGSSSTSDAGPSDSGPMDGGDGDASDFQGGDAGGLGTLDAGSGDAGEIWAEVAWPAASGFEEDCLITSAHAWADVPCAGQTLFDVICEAPMRRWSTLEMFERPDDHLSLFSVTPAPDGSVLLFGGVKTVMGTSATGIPTQTEMRSADGYRMDFRSRRFSTLPAPPASLLARTSHVAAQVDQQFIVWGGTTDDGQTAHGARLVPSASQWVDLPTLSAPTAVADACGVTIGHALFVFGGSFSDGTLFGGTQFSNDGGLYVLDEDRWVSLPTTHVPSARTGHACVALDENRVFVWGGMGPDPTHSSSLFLQLVAFNSGAIYDRSSQTWTPLATENAPSARAHMSAVAVGHKVFVFGGRERSAGNWRMTNGGGIYDVINQSWAPLPTLDAPSPRYQAKALGMEDRMLVFGGVDDFATPLSSGGFFHFAENRWRALNPRHAPGPTWPIYAVENDVFVWSGRANEPIYQYTVGIPAIDRDDDGLSDGHELYLGSDPDDADSNDDSVSDGDAIEEQISFLP